MHIPVLLSETLAYWLTDPHGLYVDCTLGGGGHSLELLKHLAPDARLVVIDKDEQILRRTLKLFDHPGLRSVHNDFRMLEHILTPAEKGHIDGILMDLGVSSFQLDTAERGFSYHEDAPLDMRMNREQNLTAAEIVNQYEKDDIAAILFEYGEERYARRIAANIVRSRSQRPIHTTMELVDIIKASVPARYSREKHPARRTFQALRIAVNTELDALKEVLPAALEALKPGGRLCVITFHSLEDRIVKNFMQENARECICPPQLPVCQCNHRARIKILTRKPVAAGEEQCRENPRARSAKLRVAEKI